MNPDEHITRAEEVLNRVRTRGPVDTHLLTALATAHAAVASAMVARDAVLIATFGPSLTDEVAPQWLRGDPALNAHSCQTCGSFDREHRAVIWQNETMSKPCGDPWHDVDESNLVAHARRELGRAGLFDADSDYGGMVGDVLLETVKAFSGYGHSGSSAAMALDALNVLLTQGNLTPLTDDPAEWREVPAELRDDSEHMRYQNVRNSKAFSPDRVKYWLIDEDITQYWTTSGDSNELPHTAAHVEVGA